MAYVKKIFNDNFLYYASYVIKDRAIPDLEDGLKPVQRRILHTLFEADDGKYHKVANIVGSCMKYHPHGDASIYSALVVLANKELFIDKQGNFGNLYTGDSASAARYIECRATPLAKDILYNPKITEYIDSYDGRNREPVVFPAKVPVVLLTGAEGIAVGMSTRILPHNPVEVLEAEIACLQGEDFQLYPDFPTAGVIDIAEYDDGQGKVRVRATLDTSDPKRIVVRDLPFGTTTESLIESVETAARAGRLKIASINDFTTDKVEIEIRLARGEYSQDTIDALYAFTQCEQSISCNLLVIKGSQPTLMRVPEVVRHHAKRLLAILKAELELQIRELLDEIHARTLERIFIEERVYKAIENKKTQEGVQKAVIDGLAPFASEIKREVTLDDVERLLKIPIRRISLYDIEKARAELERLKAKLKEARYHLAHLTEYGIAFLSGIADKLRPHWARKTKIQSFAKVDAREAARRNIALRYDPATGYLGKAVSSGEFLFDVSPYDKILVMRHTGMYSVVPVPDRLFADKGMQYCAIADKDSISSVIFTVVYRDGKTGYPCIKRCKIEGWIMGKDYQLVPEGGRLLYFTAEPKKTIVVHYEPKARLKTLDARFRVQDYDVKGLKAQGVRLSSRVASSAAAETVPGLFDVNGEPPAPTGMPDMPKPIVKAAGKQATKAKAKPATKQTAKPAAGKTAKPAAKAAAKTTTGKAAKPASKTTAGKATPVQKAPATVARRPEAAKAPVAKAVPKPVVKPAAKPAATTEKPGKDGEKHGGLLERAASKKKPVK
jgi:topoisomerase-4 subunit A